MKVYPLVMKVRPLVDVHILHDYYRDKRCLDFRLEPTPATQHRLRKARCVLKWKPHGLRILTMVDPDHRPLAPLPQDTVLTFALIVQNPDFVLFSDCSAGPNVTQGETFHLAYSVAPPTSPGAFAGVNLKSRVPLDKDRPAETLEIAFAAKRVHWTYYVITDVPNADTLRIKPRATAAPHLAFSPANRTDLVARPDLSDPVATTVAQRYPGMQRWRFVSDAPVPCQQAAPKGLQLVLDEHPIVDALPNPSLRRFAIRTIDTPGGSRRQETLFHVLTHFTR